MNDLILRQDAIDAIRTAYFDKDIQSAKDDPCIVDAMTDWAIRQIKSVPALLGDIVRTLNNGTIVFTTESLDWFNRIVLEDGKMNKKEFYPNDNWIPCSERLPKEDENVLVWYEYFRYGVYNCMYQTYGIGYYSIVNSKVIWGGDVSGHRARAIAWMPLPPPWKGKEGKA